MTFPQYVVRSLALKLRGWIEADSRAVDYDHPVSALLYTHEWQTAWVNPRNGEVRWLTVFRDAKLRSERGR